MHVEIIAQYGIWLIDTRITSPKLLALVQSLEGQLLGRIP